MREKSEATTAIDVLRSAKETLLSRNGDDGEYRITAAGTTGICAAGFLPRRDLIGRHEFW
jgi:hypothetical protein